MVVKEILGFLTLEVWTDRLCRNVFEGISTTRCVIAQKSVFLIYLTAEAWSHVKCKGLCIEIQRMWIVKCMIIPRVNGAARIVTKCLKNGSEQFKENIWQILVLHLGYHTKYGKYYGQKLEAWTVGFTVGSREVCGTERKGLWQET